MNGHNLFFLFGKRLHKADAINLCHIAEKCFDKLNLKLRVLGWYGNCKIDLEKVNVGNNLNYRLTFSYMNNSKACWNEYINYKEEVNFCDCNMCNI